MTGLLVITGFLTLIGVLAIYLGADTRDGRDWRSADDDCPDGLRKCRGGGLDSPA